MELALWVVGALIVGFVLASLMKRRGRSAEDQVEIARAEAQRDAAREQLDQIKLDRETLKESIQAFSAEQLKENREEFLKHAEERLGRTEEKHATELTQRHEAIEKQFDGVREKMETFQEMHRRIEEQRIKEFGSLHQQVVGLSQQTKAVEEASQSLSTALRGSSQSRGKWGEMALRNIVDVAGMTEHCDFVEQDQGESDGRPDMVVVLPGEGRIPIDSKVPFTEYEKAMETDDPAQQKVHLESHGKIVRTTMLELAKRDYPKLVGGRVDYTVMFIPIESVASAAFAVQPDLQQEAMEKKILIATPVTLIALLKTVSLYWQQEILAANAQQIWDETSELHDRLKTFQGHIARVGKNLGTAVEGYNKAVASYETRVLPKARVIEKLSAKEGLPELERVEKEVRQTSAPPEH
ncbi:MAG: DNA recombination protein RmuC [Acidobacteriota bacterium]|nr:DNA recombination protein RmuC [Acidobacteriota bacterium]